LQPLARFPSTLLVIASRHLTRVQPKHIPGDDNIEADFLSRTENGQIPSWEHVISQCSQLWTCRICLLLRELLSSLAWLVSSGLTAGTYKSLTIHLLTLELVIAAVSFNEHPARKISDDLAIDLIAGYITEVKMGYSLPSTSKGPLGEQSLRNYILSAAQCFTLLWKRPCIVIDPKTARHEKQVHLHPMLLGNSGATQGLVQTSAN
jgi:hypothetical protein